MESPMTAAAAGVELDGAFAGRQFRPGDDGYDEARAVDNIAPARVAAS